MAYQQKRRTQTLLPRLFSNIPIPPNARVPIIVPGTAGTKRKSAGSGLALTEDMVEQRFINRFKTNGPGGDNHFILENNNCVALIRRDATPTGAVGKDVSQKAKEQIQKPWLNIDEETVRAVKYAMSQGEENIDFGQKDSSNRPYGVDSNLFVNAATALGVQGSRTVELSGGVDGGIYFFADKEGDIVALAAKIDSAKYANVKDVLNSYRNRSQKSGVP